MNIYAAVNEIPEVYFGVDRYSPLLVIDRVVWEGAATFFKIADAWLFAKQERQKIRLLKAAGLDIESYLAALGWTKIDE